MCELFICNLGPSAKRKRMSLISSLCSLPNRPAYRSTEPEEGPPAPPGRGASRMLRASCCVGEPFWAHQNAKNLLVAGALPRTPLGEPTALPQTPSWWGGAPRGLCCPLPKNPTYNIVIVLILCVCTHVYENALLFSLEC